MVKTFLTIVVCWSFTFVVNGQIRRDVPKYLPTTLMINPIDRNVCMTAALLNWEPAPVLMLSFRLGNPQTTCMDNRKMVVMRNVLTQSTHPP